MAEEESRGGGRGGGVSRRGSFSGRGRGRGGGDHRGGGGGGGGNNHHRKRHSHQHEFTSPCGGTRSDPLNISNLSGDEHDVVDEEVLKPLEIIVPKNSRDPLNLNKLEKQRKKRQHNDSMSSPNRSSEMKSPVVSPVPRKRRSNGSPRSRKQSEAESPVKSKSLAPGSTTEAEASGSSDDPATKRKNKKEYFNTKYCYGNFDRYYGTRLKGDQKDPRMKMLKQEWFEKKSILDIGCNVGFLTLSIAKEYSPRRILGIDIDEHLVGVARKNIKHYCDKDIEFVGKYPASFSNHFGPISHLPISFSTKFPDNIWFRKENYVLESDELVEMVEEEYDVILALSISKWIHLNFGDDGMRRFFRRAFQQLLPGGRFILEPQPFSSYRKRAKMTEHLKANFAKIEFKPEDFEMYLLEEIGFESVEHLGPAESSSKGFERPVDVYVKKPPSFLSKGSKKGESKSADEASLAGTEAGDLESLAKAKSSGKKEE